MSTGQVYGSEGGVYRVRLSSGEMVDASLRGRLRMEARTGDKVVIGDRVEVELDPDGAATIEAVWERSTQILRRGPGGRKPKVVAANVDRLLVVASVADPEPRQQMLDRLLVVGEANGLETHLVLNKADIAARRGSATRGDAPGGLPPREIGELYRGIGYRVLETSALSGKGLEELRDLLSKGVTALIGLSGVGKSSLLNALEPGLGLRTGELSHRRGTGKHTTVSARLLRLSCGGLVADTPGFSDVGLWGVGAEDLEGCFPEFAPYRDECRFRGCTHLHEPDCGVKDALARGHIDPVRFESYRALAEETDGS